MTHEGAAVAKIQIETIIVDLRVTMQIDPKEGRIPKMYNGFIILKESDPEAITREGTHHPEVTDQKKKIMTGYRSATIL